MHRRVNKISYYFTAVLFLLVLISIIVTAFSFTRINTRDSELNNCVKDKDIILNLYYNYLDNSRIREYIQYAYSSYIPDKAVILYNEEDDVVSIIDVLNSNQKSVIVFKYNELNCNSCVVSEIKLIQDIFGLSNNYVKIVSSYTDITDLFYFKRENEIKYELFNLKNQHLIEKIDDLQRPYVFLLSDKGIISKLFVPTKDNQELSIMYYQYIREYLSALNL